MDLRRSLWKVAAASVGVYAVLILAGDAQALAENAWEFEWVYLVAAVGFFGASVSLRILRYNMWLRTIIPGITYTETARYYVAGLAFLVTPARMGEAVISVFLKDRFGVAKSRTVPLVLLERFYDLIGLLALLAVGMAYVEFSPLLLAIPLAAICAATFVAGRRKTMEKVISLVGRVRFLSKFAPDAAESSGTLHSLTRPKFFAASAGMGAVIPSIDITGAYLIATGAGLGVAFSDFVFVIASSVIVAALSMVPGGLFVAEGGQIGLLTGLYGVDYSKALLFSLLYRLSFTWLLTAVGFVFLKRL